MMKRCLYRRSLTKDPEGTFSYLARGEITNGAVIENRGGGRKSVRGVMIFQRLAEGVDIDLTILRGTFLMA